MIFLGVAAVIVALAFLLAGLALVAWALAGVLPIAANFWGDVQRIQYWRRTWDVPQAPSDRTAAVLAVDPHDVVPRTGASRIPGGGATNGTASVGIAPAPHRFAPDEDALPGATLPSAEPGDLDWQSEVPRPAAHGSRFRDEPPGPAAEGDPR